MIIDKTGYLVYQLSKDNAQIPLVGIGYTKAKIKQNRNTKPSNTTKSKENPKD